MRKINRRTFIEGTARGVAGVTALRWMEWPVDAAEVRHGVPPHRPIALEGLHAYASGESVAAGQTIAFHVSSTAPYRMTVCRLGQKVDDPSGDHIIHGFPESPARPQPIHPGSYIFVSKGMDADRPLRGLSMECWVRPWRTDAWAGLLGQFTFGRSKGFALLTSPDGKLAIYLGEGGAQQKLWFSNTALRKGHWQHVVAAWDGREVTCWIDGNVVAQAPFDGPVVPGDSPLRLGACGNVSGATDHFFDGDLGICAIYGRGLGTAEVLARFEDRGLTAARPPELFGCWSFSEERGDRVADSSWHERHGQVINHATWMIGGPSFNSEVPRYGDYNPAADETRGHGIRLASDDLYDCRWPAAHHFTVPVDTKPGVYVGRFHFQLENKWHQYDVTFIVRKAPRRRKAPILVLAATNTWRAYSGTPFAENSPELKQVWGTNGSRNQKSNPPAYCFYRGHSGGQGTYQLGLRVPWPAAGPYVLYGGPTDYSHLMRADRFAHVWLEDAGYDFDVITDLDLHRNPKVLNGYRVFVINGHSEYWSIPMYRGLESYLADGGNVVCLSGNSLFWRVSFNDEGTILECRKVDAPGDQLPGERRGECWHSQDGLRGGLMRECGFPGWKLIGLETLGWNNQSDPAQFGAYTIDEPDHFLFKRPHVLSMAKGDPIGQAPDGGLPRANGHEIDVRLSTLAGLQQGAAPEGTSMPDDPPGITRLANGSIPWKIGGAAFDYFFRRVKPAADQGGEMIYWERPEGGRVFNAGSIGAGWALHSDPQFQKLLQNVLHHFGVPAPIR